MCARRPSSVMPKPNFLCERAFSRSMVVMCRGGDVTCFDVMRLVAGCDEAMWLVVRWGEVMWFAGRWHVMSFDVMWFLVLCHVTWCNAMSCDVLSCDELSSVVKWFDAMGWDLMSLWCDVVGCEVTLCGSEWLCDVMSWKMMWWSVLQSTTPYYKVQLSTTQYYSVLQSTTQYYTELLRTTKYYTILRTTKYYSVLFGTTKYYCVLQSTALYYKALIRLIVATHETSSTMRVATSVTLQHHQILSPPREKTQMIEPVPVTRETLMIDLRLTWNVQYTTQSKCHPPTSPSTAPATKKNSADWAFFTWNVQYNAQGNICHPPTSRNIAPAKKNYFDDKSCLTWNVQYNAQSNKCHQHHEILHLPRNMTLMINPCLTWNVQYNAQSNKCHPPTSRNIAPATKHDSDDKSLSHI